MKIENRAMKVLALGLVAACAAGETKAAFVDYTIGDGGLVGGFTGILDGTSIDGGAGFLAGGILLYNTSGGPGLPSTYTTLCTDIGGTLYLGSSYGFSAPAPFAPFGIDPPQWGAGPGFGAAAIQNAAQLFYQYGIFGGVLSGSDANAKAGLQLAVWEALYDTGNVLGVGGGAGTRFQITGGNATAIADANADLLGLTGLYNYPGYLLIPDPLNQYGKIGQELLIDAGAFTPAPEPGTYAAAASACAVLCMLGMTRKLKRA